MRNHGNEIMEVISVTPSLQPTDPAISALEQLTRKFKGLILSLEPGASIARETYPRLSEISTQTGFRIVAPADATKMILENGRVMFSTVATVDDALMGIKQGVETLKNVLGRMASLPLFNSMAFKSFQKLGEVIKALHKLPEIKAVFADLEKFLMSEAELAAMIIHTANTNFFACGGSLTSVGAVISLLGTEGIQQMLVVRLYEDMVKQLSVSPDLIARGRDTAGISASLATRVRMDRLSMGRIRLGALLSEIGCFALAATFLDDYTQMLPFAGIAAGTLHELEHEAYGLDHAEIGGRMMQEWGFPEYLCRIVSDHHRLSLPTWQKYCRPIFCAQSFLDRRAKKPFAPFEEELHSFFPALEESDDPEAIFNLVERDYVRFLADLDSQRLAEKVRIEEAEMTAKKAVMAEKAKSAKPIGRRIF